MAKLQREITDVVLDFDGTCTQIARIHSGYLEHYRQGLNAVMPQIVEGLPGGGHWSEVTGTEWQDAQAEVRARAPEAAWMISGTPSAPAAADPYILADESARYILREREMAGVNVPGTVYSDAYTANAAPWREEAREVILWLNKKNVRVHFVSNSSSKKISQRLKDLFAQEPEQVKDITIASDAAKFRICEPAWDARVALPEMARECFYTVPAVSEAVPRGRLHRPVYVRRGTYFEALYRALAGDLGRLSTTLVCGDIWEMDLALPYALGTQVHLLKRAHPFDTYNYELEAMVSYGARAKVSGDLHGLRAWFS